MDEGQDFVEVATKEMGLATNEMGLDTNQIVMDCCFVGPWI